MASLEEDSILVKIKASGICGSYLHYMRGVFKHEKIPVTLGHEMSGVIERVGLGVRQPAFSRIWFSFALHQSVSLTNGQTH